MTYCNRPCCVLYLRSISFDGAYRLLMYRSARSSKRSRLSLPRTSRLLLPPPAQPVVGRRGSSRRLRPLSRARSPRVSRGRDLPLGLLLPLGGPATRSGPLVRREFSLALSLALLASNLGLLVRVLGLRLGLTGGAVLAVRGFPVGVDCRSFRRRSCRSFLHPASARSSRQPPQPPRWPLPSCPRRTGPASA